MYKVGDKIVYPMHGAGIIEAIEDRKILDRVQRYYIMKMPIGDMQVMIPLTSCDEIGVRCIIKHDEAQQTLDYFKEYAPCPETNWNKRYRDNMGKIKTGCIKEVLEVVKNLMFLDQTRGLSTGERKMLSNTKQILMSEIILACGIDFEELNGLLCSMVQECIEGQVDAL